MLQRNLRNRFVVGSAGTAVVVAIVAMGIMPMSAGANTTRSTTPSARVSSHVKANKSPYKIGAILTFSGPAAFVGEDAIAGMKIAIKNINAAGGIKGHPLQAVYLDDALSATTAVTDLAKIKSEGIKFLVTQASPVVDALKPLVAKDKILTINQAATDPTIANAGAYMFTNIATALTEAQSLVGYMKTQNVKSVGFLVDSTSIGESAQSSMESYMKKDGIAVNGEETYAQNTTDFSAQLVALQQANPDAIFMDDTGPSTTVDILQQAQALGIKTPFYSNTFFEAPTLPSLAGPLINGVVFDEVGFTPTLNKQSSRLQTEYHAAGNAGVAPIYTATAYDAVYLMAAAMDKAGYSSVAAREALVKLKGFVGATGNLTFNSAGQVSMQVEINKVENDQFVTIQK
jgi:branched-chain amino acid transport system substrate-binding protein